MRIDLLMEALPIMGTGYLGIFIVTGVIIGVVAAIVVLCAAAVVVFVLWKKSVIVFKNEAVNGVFGKIDNIFTKK